MPRESVIHSPAGIDQLPLYRFSNHFMAPSPYRREADREHRDSPTHKRKSLHFYFPLSWPTRCRYVHLVGHFHASLCASTYSRIGWRRRRGSRRHSTQCRASGCKIQPFSSHEDPRQYRRQPCSRRRRCNGHRRRKDGTRLPCRCRCRGVLRQVLQYLGRSLKVQRHALAHDERFTPAQREHLETLGSETMEVSSTSIFLDT
jgi:hypothetical protein